MLRELQRAGCTRSLLEADVVSAFDVAAAGAAEVVERLRTAGVVALVPAVDQGLYRCGDGEQGQLIWKTGVAGNAIAKARIGKRMSRADGQRLLEGLLVRVAQINADSDELYDIERVELFGSMLSDDASEVGDVDVRVLARCLMAL